MANEGVWPEWPADPNDDGVLLDIYGGVWQPVDPYGDRCLACLLGDIRRQRLGGVAKAWLLAKPGNEVIEHWIVEFGRPEGQRGCWYRYRVDQPDSGRVYPYIDNALRGEGGTPLDEALAEGLALGLALPPDCPD